jgi:hypothetical protein
LRGGARHRRRTQAFGNAARSRLSGRRRYRADRAAEARARADDLWKHTCFEAFISAGQGYGEINLSPSGQWAAYSFDGYRSGMAVREGFEPLFAEDHRADASYDLIAELDLTDLPSNSDWSIGLSAVIELTDGRRCFWALRHAPGPPDFHHPDAFALNLPAESP